MPAIPILALLVCSNLFMTVAWYGHLRFPDAKLWVAILVSWGIAGAAAFLFVGRA